VTAEPDLRAAIVGAGPSGFYAAAQLLATTTPRFAVDLFDRLPTPYGLVRAGVAPDHPKIKSVTRAFDKTAGHERFRFFGHVELGTDVTRVDLLDRYHVVVYAVGTSTDRRLGIPGEDLAGAHSATEFVAWYNGHPDHSGLEFDLHTARQAVVVGAGNVAIDVARMLALGPSELRVTDTADHAIEVLSASGIQDVTILARRGPLQAAFTNPELLEIGELERADVEIVGGALDPLSQAALVDADKTRRRNVEIVGDYAARRPTGKPLTVRFRFLAAPVELCGDDGRVRGVRIERNEIVRRGDGSLGARGTGQFDELPAQLVFRSIGYRGAPLAGIPFDEDRGLIRNAGGRVCDAAGEPLPGEYVAGWIKRGPSGVIGTNKKDAHDTVGRILEDAAAGRLGEPTRDDIEELIATRAVHAVDWDGWQAIDQAETSAGAPHGRPRVKLTTWEALRDASRGRLGS
jgi:ferredoxin/flavodoxin---NADP+ reductase